jgi:hypothetical protein
MIDKFALIVPNLILLYALFRLMKIEAGKEKND